VLASSWTGYSQSRAPKLKLFPAVYGGLRVCQRLSYHRRTPSFRIKTMSLGTTTTTWKEELSWLESYSAWGSAWDSNCYVRLVRHACFSRPAISGRLSDVSSVGKTPRLIDFRLRPLDQMITSIITLLQLAHPTALNAGDCCVAVSRSESWVLPAGFKSVPKPFNNLST
jgi:hypothetical protein